MSHHDDGFYDPDKIIRACRRSVSTFDDVLAKIGFFQGIDEIAYLLPGEPHLNEFLRAMVRHEGVAHFNGAEDHVHTLPLRTCYDVRYEFLSIPAGDYQHEFRIEAMHIPQGFSPLHYAEILSIVKDNSLAAAVHASFKVQDEDDYATANHRLREAGWECVQRCDSTYGKFGYWQPVDREQWLPDGPFMYLKPRVNTRDGAVL